MKTNMLVPEMTLRIQKVDSISPNVMMWIVSAVAVLSLLPIWLNYDIISPDGAFQYIPTARFFLEGNFLAGLSQPQPLFPLLIAGVSWMTGFNPELAGRMLSAGAFILAALGMFKLSELIFHDKWIALIAVLFLITNRELVENSVDCLKESLLVGCILWGNYFVLKGIQAPGRVRIALLLGGLLFLLGMFMRSTTLFFVEAWLILWAFNKKGSRVMRMILLVIPAVLFVFLWFINPELPFYKKSYNLGLIFNGPHTIYSVLQAAGGTVVDFFSTGNPFIVVIGCIGLFFREKDLYSIHLCLAMAIFLAILSAWEFVSGRYLLVLIAWICPLAAYTTMMMARSMNRTGKIAAFLVVITACIFWMDKALEGPDTNKIARKDAGFYILEHAGPDQKVITNRDRLAFYAKGEYVPLEEATDAKKSSNILAIDIEKADGKAENAEVKALGKKPARVFGTIYVYLPGS